MSTTTELKPISEMTASEIADMMEFGCVNMENVAPMYVRAIELLRKMPCNAEEAIATWNRRSAAHGEQSKGVCDKCNGSGIGGYYVHAPTEDGVEALRCDACDGFGTACSAEQSEREAPEGCVIVPKEPTDEMQLAGAQAIRFDTTALNKIWTGNAVYRAMIAAAPSTAQKDGNHE